MSRQQQRARRRRSRNDVMRFKADEPRPLYMIVDEIEMAETEHEKVKHAGGCHCGAVRFEVWAPSVLDVVDCNCSICNMKRNTHFIVPDKDFQLTKGEDLLTCYTFNSHQAKHTFCSVCGVQSFYTPRSNPDGKAVTIHCLDPGTVQSTTVTTFNGLSWEKSMEEDPSIKARSKS